MNIEFVVRGEPASVKIEVLKRLYPDAHDMWDVDWIVTHIEVDIPGYRASFDADL